MARCFDSNQSTLRRATKFDSAPDPVQGYKTAFLLCRRARSGHVTARSTSPREAPTATWKPSCITKKAQMVVTNCIFDELHLRRLAHCRHRVEPNTVILDRRKQTSHRHHSIPNTPMHWVLQNGNRKGRYAHSRISRRLGPVDYVKVWSYSPSLQS